jgi:hypothetical protein
MRQARHEQQLRRYHDRNVKETSFNVGHLVLRRIQKTDGMQKLPAPPGKDPSSSRMLSTRPHIDSSGATGKEYPTPGTWSIYVDSIRRLVLNLSYAFPFLVTFFQI